MTVKIIIKCKLAYVQFLISDYSHAAVQVLAEKGVDYKPIYIII